MLMDKLDPVKIHMQLAAMWQTSVAIVCFDSLPSTNTYALTQPCSANGWHVYLAESQSAGRGRLGRAWHSPRGENIYCSLSWAIALTPAQQQRIAALSLVAGLSVVKILQTFAPDVCWQVKWPNDIWGNGQKVAGILLESQTSGTLTQLVLGLGVNVNGCDYSSIVRHPPASSLALLTTQTFDRNDLIAAIINQFLTDSQQFFEHGLTAFQVRWAQVDALIGQKLAVTVNNVEEIGIARGIDAVGQLLIDRVTGTQMNCSVGEVQLMHCES